MAEAEKALGTEQFKLQNWDQAIVHYSKAIEIEASHVLYSNRSACFCGLRQYEDALKDAQKCIEMKSDWGKVRTRTGTPRLPPRRNISAAASVLVPFHSRRAGADPPPPTLWWLPLPGD